MAEMRIFISSTCYDLSLLRSQLRTFIRSMGYEPIMSDYEDVLYDPRIHTHSSCVDEVKNCDMLVLIIGSRFGGRATQESLSKINFDALMEESASVDALKNKEYLSVTQLEVLSAIENSIPVYTFIEKRIWHYHALYEKNKTADIIDKIVFPSIEKQETAKYIFDFINFVRLRSKGNDVFTFEKGQDIEETLKKQWSGLFQRLLQEQRFNENDRKRIDALGEQFEDLKTAILSSIENVDQRKTARSIVKFRRLSEVLIGLGYNIELLQSADCSFQQLLEQYGINKVVDIRELEIVRERYMTPRVFLIKEDSTFFEVRMVKNAFLGLETEWETFKQTEVNIKRIALEALAEMFRPSSLVRYHNEHIQEYMHRQFSSLQTADTKKSIEIKLEDYL